MCLCKVVDKKEQVESTGKGFKVFINNDGNLTSVVKSTPNLPTEEWIQSRSLSAYESIILEEDRKVFGYEKYPIGWHVFENEKDARDYVSFFYGLPFKFDIRQVEWKHQLAKGFERFWVSAEEERKCPVTVSVWLKIKESI